MTNLGVADYGTLQELIVLRRDAGRFAPSVVIWFFFEGNDFYDDNNFSSAMMAPPDTADDATHPEDLARSDRWKDRSFLLNVVRRLRSWSDPILPNRMPYFAHISQGARAGEVVYFADYAAVPWSDRVAGQWEQTQDALQEGLAFSQENGIELLVVFVPMGFRVYRPFVELPPNSPIETWRVWPLRPRFSRFCGSAGIPCADLTPDFQRAVRAGGLPYGPADTHWSPEGHDLVAERLAEELRERRWPAPSPEG